MILTPEQACKSILEMMNRWADTVPEDRRDAVMEKMFNMFQGPVHETGEKPEKFYAARKELAAQENPE